MWISGRVLAAEGTLQKRLPYPSMHSARKLAGWRAARIDSAAKEDPVACEHIIIKIVVLQGGVLRNTGGYVRPGRNL